MISENIISYLSSLQCYDLKSESKPAINATGYLVELRVGLYSLCTIKDIQYLVFNLWDPQRGRWSCFWPPVPRHLVNDRASLRMRNSLPKIPTLSLLSTNDVSICPEIKSEQRGERLKWSRGFQTRGAHTEGERGGGKQQTNMPRSFLVKSKRAHSYHQPRCLDDDYSKLDTILAHACAGRLRLCAITHGNL